MSTKKTKAAKAATKKNTKPAKNRVRKPRTEAQKARRRELDAIRRAEAKKHAVAAKHAKKCESAFCKAVEAYRKAMETAWTKFVGAISE